MMTKRECSVGGCERSHLAKGMCKLHYYRFYRRGHVFSNLQLLEDQFKALDSHKLAYAAGYLDADGSFMLASDKGNVAVPRISAVSIDRPVLEFMVSLFGGTMRSVSRKNPNPKHKPIFVWNITDARAIAVARVVMPYLVIKGVQAYLLSCFDYESKWEKGGVDVTMPPQEKSRRHDLMLEMRDWNARAYFERA